MKKKITKDNKYICKKCGRKYKTKNNLQKHIEEKHSFFAIIKKYIKKYKWILSIFSIYFSIIFFYHSYKPDLQIEVNNPGRIDWNNLRYHFNIKNYGKSTANDVEVSLDMNYYAGQLTIMKQLPPGESCIFTFDAAPPMPVTLPNPFLDYIKKILSGEKAGVGTIIIKYNWLWFTFNGPEYSVEIKRNGYRLYKK